MIQTWLLKLLAQWGGTIALISGIGVAALAWDRNAVKRGVQQEQVRVETIGKKLDAQAGQARAKVERKPPAEISADLRRYCRDC